VSLVDPSLQFGLFVNIDTAAFEQTFSSALTKLMQKDATVAQILTLATHSVQIVHITKLTITASLSSKNPLAASFSVSMSGSVLNNLISFNNFAFIINFNDIAKAASDFFSGKVVQSLSALSYIPSGGVKLPGCGPYQQEGGLCYHFCGDNYDNNGAGLCIENCPDGYNWAPLTCWKGASTQWTCHCGWGGCSNDDCDNGYYRSTSCTCQRDLRSINRGTYWQSVVGIPKYCDDGWSYVAGLCDPNCQPGYTSVVGICWLIL